MIFLMVEVAWFRAGIKDAITTVVGPFENGMQCTVWSSQTAQSLRKLNERLDISDPDERLRLSTKPVPVPADLREPYTSRPFRTADPVGEAERRYALIASVGIT